MKNVFLILGALGLGVWGLRKWEGAGSSSAGNFGTVAGMNQGTVVACFTADWCGACKAVKPHVAALSQEMKGRVSFVTVDVDSEPALAGQYGIRAIPAFVLLKDGREVTRFNTVSRDGILAKIGPHL